MHGKFQPVTNPVELAAPFAEELTTRGYLDGFNRTAEEEQNIVLLDKLAAEYDMLDKQYFVQSGRSVLVPASFEADEPLLVTQFDELMFEGELKTHSIVRLGRNMGGQAIRALCLTFDNVTLLPHFDTIRDDELLHVPVLAVRDIDRT